MLPDLLGMLIELPSGVKVWGGITPTNEVYWRFEHQDGTVHEDLLAHDTVRAMMAIYTSLAARDDVGFAIHLHVLPDHPYACARALCLMKGMQLSPSTG